jgi:hypothetical protein
VYADSTAVLGPLAHFAEPHSYDLCAEHADSLTVPRGWNAVRLSDHFEETGPSPDDLSALADAVRRAGTASQPTVPPPTPEAGRRGHLRVLRGDER